MRSAGFSFAVCFLRSDSTRPERAFPRMVCFTRWINPVEFYRFSFKTGPRRGTLFEWTGLGWLFAGYPLGPAPDCQRSTIRQAVALWASHLWDSILGIGCNGWLNGVCPSGGPPFCRGRKEAKSAQGQAPGPRRTAKGLRPGVCNSNPPPCLSPAVRSTIVSA